MDERAPVELPVLLIMLGRGLSARQLQEIREGHTGPVRHWNGTGTLTRSSMC